MTICIFRLDHRVSGQGCQSAKYHLLICVRVSPQLSFPSSDPFRLLFMYYYFITIIISDAPRSGLLSLQTRPASRSQTTEPSHQ